MKNAKSLEDFIRAYIENTKISTSPEGYSEWLKSYGVDSKRILNESLTDIGADYEKSKSTYGQTAETLGSSGLTGSGYSDYLSGKAYETMQKRKAGAYETYSQNEEKNKSGYYGYVSEIIKSAEERATAENEAFNKTVNSIVDAGIRDRDEAYRYAIQMGMSEEKATEAANAAVTMANRKLTEETFRFIINHGFDKTGAKEYALASGLDEETAERLAAYAEEISSNPYLTSDYLDYLRQKEDQYK